jgi:hypothetical protein
MAETVSALILTPEQRFANGSRTTQVSDIFILRYNRTEEGVRVRVLGNVHHIATHLYRY